MLHQEQKITLEGCIEDIDVIREDNITAIQCKYILNRRKM